MRNSFKKMIVIILIFIFSGFVFFVSYVNPELGERILYGKKGLEKKQYLEYSEIIISGNYDCMESASNVADGNLPLFVKEFNKCNNKAK